MLTPLPELIASARAGLRCLDAATAMTELQLTGGQLIDVREAAEREALPVPGSVNIPRGILEMKVTELVPRADQPVYLHCATGGRASMAGEQLQRMGYTSVTVITCPVEVIRECQEAS
jgi:rhodanese-related sulfurtransferase